MGRSCARMGRCCRGSEWGLGGSSKRTLRLPLRNRKGPTSNCLILLEKISNLNLPHQTSVRLRLIKICSQNMSFLINRNNTRGWQSRKRQRNIKRTYKFTKKEVGNPKKSARKKCKLVAPYRQELFKRRSNMWAKNRYWIRTTTYLKNQLTVSKALKNSDNCNSTCRYI